MALHTQLGRAIAAFRFASLGSAAILLVVDRDDDLRLPLAWGVLAGMLAWTVFTTYAYARPAGRTRGRGYMFGQPPGPVGGPEGGQAAAGRRTGLAHTRQRNHEAIVGAGSGARLSAGTQPPPGAVLRSA